MGFVLMKNFDRPYLSSNLVVFWRKWHISLSTWFRDYLYISLGGNRVSPSRRDINLMITFLVSGLWHGANWTFVIWGAIHGTGVFMYNTIKRLLGKYVDFSERKKSVIAQLPGIIFTFFVVTLAWVFFRASSLKEAVNILSYIFSYSKHTSWFEFPVINHNVSLGLVWYLFVAFLIVFLIFSEEVLAKCQNKFTDNLFVDSAWIGLIMFLILTMGVFNQNSFIYFQF
jgi:D-alanyl-lipoteichoic acid acyltransferase DltB (MBOAT superfamily)